MVKHGQSSRHGRCQEFYINRTQPNSASATAMPIRAVVARHLKVANENALQQLKMKFNIEYTIVKEELAFTKFPTLIALHRKNGLDINPTYDNDVRCAEMVGQIADSFRDALAAQLQDASYLSILIDGDMDISNQECEIVYVRFVEDGKPVTRLVRQQALSHCHVQG